MTTALIGSTDPVSTALAAAVGSPVYDVNASLPPCRGVVIVVGADPAPRTTNAHLLGDAEWTALSELPLRRTLRALQNARASMQPDGGRIVLITATIGMAGGSHLVPYTTFLEGARAMAKSAARQWYPEGIAVNTIAVPVQFLGADIDSSHLTAAPLRDADTLIGTVVETARFLLRPDVHLVGETVVADGGAVMLP